MLSFKRATSLPSSKSDLCKRHLSVPRQRLVTIGQLLLFGTIYNLKIQAGDPVLDPMPRIIRRKMNSGMNQPRPQADSPDFALKRKWVEFFRDLDAIRDGEILTIDFAHGLPNVYEFEDVIRV